MIDIVNKNTLEVIRFAATVPTVWKNGLGQSRLIAKSPVVDGLDWFDWQVSLASMTGTLPFSDYPGIDRSLYVVAGEGLQVKSANIDVVVTSNDGPLKFDGAEKIVGTTVGETEMHDFNILSRRGVISHRSQRITLPAGGHDHTTSGLCLVYVQSGTVVIAFGDLQASLDGGDSAIVRSSENAALNLASNGDSTCIVADFYKT